MSHIVVPQLGESVVEARVARWLKKAGDRVAAGEPVVELETEKIDIEVGAERGGVLASIVRQEGEDVKVGDVLATIDDSVAAEEPRATPTARRMAREHDVNIGALQGTGAAGRVMKADVRHALDSVPAGGDPSQPPSAPSEPPATVPAVPPDPATSANAPSAHPTTATGAPAVASAPVRGTGVRLEERQRMSKRRQTIARRLVEAQRTAAMLSTFNEIDMTALLALRERRKEAFAKRYGTGLGMSSFFVKASVAALRAFPQLNAEIQGDEIVLKRYYDIGVAVGAEGGLVVPVLRDADRMAFPDVERGIRDFATRAGAGSLTLEDLRGGTFTITNGGVFGSLLSTPILNTPQVGILGLHKVEERPVAVKGQVVVRPMMYVALSYDHRIVDGREAVQFLVMVKEFIEDPGHLLLES